MDIKKLTIDKNDNLKNAMLKLDETAKKILFVTDEGVLYGTLTDGDIRRWILKNGNLNGKIEMICNKQPIYLNYKQKRIANRVMTQNNIHAIPLINEENVIVAISFLNEDELYLEKINIPVVIMAGGKGTRLYPYTKILPKPLIPIGDTPIVERIIDKFHLFGCENFYLTLNHKKNMIKAYFNETEKKYKVNYIDEDIPLGTGGSLSFLKGIITDTFFVTNCDIIVDFNYAEILKFHKRYENSITVVASLKHTTIPYGVMHLKDDGTVDYTEEKPEITHLINTGMYILEAEVLKYVPDNTFIHLPDIIGRCKEDGLKIGVYPISEKSWMDMGQIEEMESMIKKFDVQN